MNLRTILLAMPIALSSVAANAGKLETDLYNAAALLTSDRLCGTAYASDGRYKMQVQMIALLNGMSTESVENVAAGLSARQEHDIEVAGTREKICAEMWKLY